MNNPCNVLTPAMRIGGTVLSGMSIADGIADAMDGDYLNACG